LDKLDPTWLEWAGRKTGKLGDGSMCQFIEFPILEDEETEYPAFNSDMSGWIINKYLPKAFNSLKALENLSFKNCLGWGSLSFAMQFLNPEVMKAFQTLSEAGQLAAKFYGEVAAFNAELEALGFPLVMKATTVAAFDTFSNNLRGTILSLQDIIAEPDEMKKAIEQFYPGSLYGALTQAKYSNGIFVYIPMHKGMDGFMSDAQYREFYWDTLKRLIMALIDMGHTPWIYTEGKYDSRLKYLTELPRGKVWIHFEDVDMKEAKRLVGANACISGGIQAELLRTATTDEVRDEVKRNMDICAPGGGYIFDFGESMDDCKPENVETLFDTVKTYGKYR
jgi:hypothetical protein